MAEPWLSAYDIAVHLGVTKDTVYTWIAEKAMPARKVGRLWKFQASAIDDWVREGEADRTHELHSGHPGSGDSSTADDNDEHGKG